MSRTPKVAVVVLNWNGLDWFRKFAAEWCESILDEDAQLVIADNASTDESISWLKENLPAVTLYQLDQNYGFAEGYVKTLTWVRDRIGADYYVLLNNDARTPKGWLTPLVDALEKDKTLWAVMPKILSYHQPSFFEYAGASGGFLDRLGFPFCRGRILDNVEQDHAQYDNPIDVHWASGAALCVRADRYWQSGGLDGRFWAHMEEIDLCFRMRRMGGRIGVVPQSVVFHVGGGSLANESPKKLFLNFRNSLWMLHRNLPYPQRWHILIARMLVDGAISLAYLLKGNWRAFCVVIRAHSTFWRTRSQWPYRPYSHERPVARYPHLILWQRYFHRRIKWSQLPSEPVRREI